MTLKLGIETYVRVDDVSVNDELLLRPIDEDHVAKLTVQWKFNPSAAPSIIVQKISNAIFVRVHCHSFMALRRAGEERIRCRYIEGKEHEIRAYGLLEQSQIKDFTPQQYHDNIIIIRDALREENGKCSLRDLEEFTHLKKSQIHKLIQGFEDEDIKKLMDEGYSFTKAYRTVHLVDKPKVKEPEEDLTKSREATPEEDLDQLQTKGHLKTHSVPPSAVDGKDGETKPPVAKISPDGGSESSVGTPSITKEIVPETEPEPPPSKPTFEKRQVCLNCFKPLKFGAKATDKKAHDCKNPIQQIECMNYQFPNMAVLEDKKNGYRLKHNSMSMDELYNGKKTVEHAQKWLGNIHNAFENEIKEQRDFDAKAKIGGS
jgi:hypothetical protein